MNPLPFWLKILETFLFPPSLTPMFRFHDFLCFLSATNRPGIGRSSRHRLYISVRNTKEVRCQKETPMESHRRKRHRSESSWKKARSSGIYASLCVSDCCQSHACDVKHTLHSQNQQGYHVCVLATSLWISICVRWPSLRACLTTRRVAASQFSCEEGSKSGSATEKTHFRQGQRLERLSQPSREESKICRCHICLPTCLFFRFVLRVGHFLFRTLNPKPLSFKSLNP